MDDDVIEISPSNSRSSKSLKHKEIIVRNVIDFVDDENSADVVIIGQKFDPSKKGKGIQIISEGCTDHPVKEALSSSFGVGVEILGSASAVESESFPSASHNFIELDDHSSDCSYEDDDSIDHLFCDDLMEVDEYSILQAQFDHVDIPSGIEAPIPWLPGPTQSQVNAVSGSTSSNCAGVHGLGLTLSSWLPLPDPAPLKMKAISAGISNVKAQMDAVNHLEVDQSFPWFPSKPAQSKKTPTAVKSGSSGKIPLGIETSKSKWPLDPLKRKKKQVSINGSNVSSFTQSEALKLHPGVETSLHYVSNSVKEPVATSNTHYSDNPMHIDSLNYPHGFGLPITWWPKSFKHKKRSFINHGISLHDPQGDVIDMPWVQDSARAQKYAAAASNSRTPDEAVPRRDLDDILRKFDIFKQFDIVQDHSDHHYSGSGSSNKQPFKKWVKRVQEEWSILEKDLPATIFVRVYETRMDLLRAVIVGAEGTPYHDGLFFFDVFFPSSYPSVPPHVYYHSGGLRLNPNLYNCGKVCLSLLNTWSGNKNEMWNPGVSTMLQVLVSIQALILNMKPYFNEPGYAHTSGSAAGEKKSQHYNEDTFILSLRTMMYTMRRPPKHFEDFVLGHFCKRAHDILVACKAYMDGAQVGCLVQGGVQDLDAGDKSCSKKFKNSLPGYVGMLVKEFTNIGAKECEKFLPSTANGNKQVGSLPNTVA